MDRALAPGCPSGQGRSTTNRLRTAARQAAALRGRLPDPAARLKRVLANRAGAPYSVSKTAAPDSPSLTLAGIVMDLSGDRIHLCAGPPHRGRWVARPGA